MAKQTNYITSHRSRVQKAKEIIAERREKVSVFDREAFVEFFLLEDIARLYEHRLEEEKSKKVETRAGQMAKERNIQKFTAVLNLFKSAIEIAWGQITAGNYSGVYQSIPERPLMTAANNTKYLPQLRKIAVKMLKILSDEAMLATQESISFDEALDELEDHEANVRAIKGLPSVSEISEVIKAAELAIPDDKKVVKKPTPKLN